MDAVPVTLGQEFGGYAAQIRLGADRVRDARSGASARSRSRRPPRAPASTPIPSSPSASAGGWPRRPGSRSRRPPTRSRPRATATPWSSSRGALRVVAVSLIKIANDIALMGSGPRAGLAEIRLPELQKGSSIMPGKVNPVICEVVIQVGDQVIGNDAAVAIAGSQGQFELNVRVPLIARNLLDSIKLLAAASRLFGRKCVSGIEPNEEMLERHASYAGHGDGAQPRPCQLRPRPPRSSRRPPTRVGRFAEVARELGVDESVLDQALDHHRLARPHD